MNNKNREILLMDKGFMISVVETLKTLDVRGYESNEKLVGVVHDLQQAIVTKLPLEMVPNTGNTETAKKAESCDISKCDAHA